MKIDMHNPITGGYVEIGNAPERFQRKFLRWVKKLKNGDDQAAQGHERGAVVMNVLRFACGAESPPYKGSFPEWVQKEIKSVMNGYALGHRRNDGRYRVIVFDLNGGLKSPRMPDGGGPASCLSCPCAKAAGMKKKYRPRKSRTVLKRIGQI